MIPPQLAARLVVLVGMTVGSTAAATLLQGRPVLKWGVGKFGPKVVHRVADRVEDRLSPQDEADEK